MKLSSFIVAFGLAGSITATAISLENREQSAISLEKRQQTIPATLSAIVSALSTTVNANLVTINNLVQDVNGNVAGSAAVIAAVNAQLAAIKVTFQTAINGIAGITGAGVGGIVGAVTSFTGPQLAQLLQDVQTIVQLIQNLKDSLALIKENLTPAALAFLTQEYNALQALITPFLGPLIILVSAVAAVNPGSPVIITGIGEAITGLLGVVGNLLQSIFG